MEYSSRRNAWLPCPVVPPQLWLTGAAIGIAGLILYFEDELWPHHPQAIMWSWSALATLLQVAAVQTIAALWRWPAAYAGPRGVRWIIRAAAGAVGLGITLLMLLLAVGSCLIIWGLLQQGN
jgi:hypothetical protein